MNSDDLIRRLSSDVAPVAPRALEKRWLIGAAAGIVAGVIILIVWLGPQPDLASAPFAQAFLTKIVYTGLLAACAMAASIHLMRPDAKPATWFWLAIAPVFALGALAGAEVIRTPQDAWPALIVGGGASACLMRILIISLPIFVALIWTARRFAPTRLRAAGAAIGLAAGSIGAAIYAVHCIETASCFIFLWYSAAILIAAAIGALIAPRLLRW